MSRRYAAGVAVIVLSVLSLLLIAVIIRALRIHAAVEDLTSHGAEIVFEYQLNEKDGSIDLNVGRPTLYTCLVSKVIFANLDPARLPDSGVGRIGLFRDLQWLYLGDRALTAKEIEVLCRMPNLKTVLCRPDAISNQDLAKLRTCLPDAKIHVLTGLPGEW